MTQDCRALSTTLGVVLSASLTVLAPSVTQPHRSDAADRLGGTKSVEPRCARAAVAGMAVVVTELVVMEVVVIASIQDGMRAPSVGLTTLATSVSAIARCIAATITVISWTVPLVHRQPGVVDAASLSAGEDFPRGDQLKPCLGQVYPSVLALSHGQIARYVSIPNVADIAGKLLDCFSCPCDQRVELKHQGAQKLFPLCR